MKVAVLGVSLKPERYSHQALVMLLEKGHEVYPINPALTAVEGVKVYHTLAEVPAALDVVTFYLGVARQTQIVDDLLAAKPRHVIFNPGTENPALAARLNEVGITTEEACTLVLLRTGNFDHVC